jgi:hypothetical protein
MLALPPIIRFLASASAVKAPIPICVSVDEWLGSASICDHLRKSAAKPLFPPRLPVSAVKSPEFRSALIRVDPR